MIKLTHWLLLFIFLLAANFLYAQQKADQKPWHLIIVDGVTNQAINKATVSIYNKKFYLTDYTGKVTIDSTFIHEKDRVKISCIGYYPQSFQLNNQYPDTIKLSPSAVALKEVAINPSKKAGREKKNKNLVHRVTSPSSTYAQFIPNANKRKGMIMSVEYQVNDELHGIEMPFRARLYTKMEDSITMDKELTTDTIIVYNPERKTKISVDVSPYHIPFPEDGVIAVFEILPPSFYSRDSVWYTLYGLRQQYIKTPGLDMMQTKNNWEMDRSKSNRTDRYSMVGPPANRWNWNGAVDQWYVYAEGNNYVIDVTVDEK